MARTFQDVTQYEPESAFTERLRFVIWWGAVKLGVETQKDFAAAIQKGDGQLSSWLAAKPKPSFETIKAIAGLVGLSASWLDHPDSPDAAGREPQLFEEWVESRRKYRAGKLAEAKTRMGGPLDSVAKETETEAKPSTRKTPAKKTGDHKKTGQG